MVGGFSLQKWITSNYFPDTLVRVPVERQISYSTVHIDVDDLIVHTLGLCWQPSKDMFQFTLNLSRTEVITKRTPSYLP